MRSFRRGVPMLAHFAYRGIRTARRRSDAGAQRASGRLTASNDYSGSTAIGRATPAPTDGTERMTSRILVVDDDTALAEMIGIVLRTEGFDPVVLRRRRRGARRVPRVEARPRPARPDAARHGRHRGLHSHPRRVRHADHHAHRQDRHRRRREGPRVGRRRLHRQAVQPEGARRPHPHPAAAGARPVDETLAHRRPHGRRRGPRGAPRRRPASPSRRSSSSCCSRSPRSRSRCSPARCCSSRCGATTTRPTPGS